MLKKQIHMKKIVSVITVAVMLLLGWSGIAAAAEFNGDALTSPADASTYTLNFQNDTITGGTADGVYYNAQGEATIANGSTVANDFTVFMSDAGSPGTPANEAVGGTILITADKTLSWHLGAVSSAQATDVDGAAGIDFQGAITGGGNLAITGGNYGADATKTSLIAFKAANTFGTLTIDGQNGGTRTDHDQAAMSIEDMSGGILTVSGNATVTGTFGGPVAATVSSLLTVTEASSNVLVSGAYTYIGGTGGTNASDAAGGAGGNLTLTQHTGNVTVTTGTYTISGGTGGTSAEVGSSAIAGAGGLTTISAHAGDVASATWTIKGGDGGTGLAGDAGAGGQLTLSGAAGDFTGTTLNIVGGKGGDGTLNLVNGGGGTGGAMAASAFTGNIGTAAANSTLNIGGGDGGAGGNGVSASGGIGAIGGANVTAFGLATGVVNGTVNVYGGAAGAAGLTTAGFIGGAAGAGAAVDNVSFASVGGTFNVSGGHASDGGAATTAGVGAAGALGGAATVDLVTIMIGTGATSALVNAGGTVAITGGNGSNAGHSLIGYNGGAAAVGGNALVSDMRAPDIATLTVTAGNGGNGGNARTGVTGIAGGAAGTATITTTTTGTMEVGTINIIGGNGGDAGANSVDDVGGAGIIGGAAAYTNTIAAIYGQAGASDDITINITGGDGGDGGTGGASARGTNGVNGGTATFTSGGATSVRANIVLDDGTAGSAGATSTNTGGDAGAGGHAILAIATAAHTITGTITAAADGEGSITTAAGRLTMAGNIGTAAKELDDITLGHADGLTTDGDIYAKDITLEIINSQLVLNSTDAAVVSGAIGAGTANGGEDLTTGTAAIYTFEGAVGKSSGGASQPLIVITTGANSVQTFKSTVNSTSLVLHASSTTSFGDAVTLTGLLAVGNGATITLTDTIVAGETVLTVANNALSVDTAATVNMPQNFNSGTITLLVDSGGGGTGAADAAKLQVNPGTLATYAAAVGGTAHKIDITATKKSTASIASALGVTEDAAVGLDRAVTAAAGDTAVAALMNTVLVAGGAAAAKMAEQVMGSQDALGATSGAATASAGAAVVSVGSSRMAALRTGDAYASTLGTGFNIDQEQRTVNAYASTHGTGFNAGSGAQSNSVWMKPFASFGDQSIRGGVAGYDADTYGMAVGGDTRVNANSIAGLSFSFADTDIDGKGAGQSHSDIKSYQLTAYADYTEKDWYVEGLVGYAHNDMDTSREISVTSKTAKGDTKSGQYMVSVNAGMPMKVEEEGWSGAYFTPTLGLSITQVSNKEYTETGAGVLNLRVNPEDITIAKASLGGRLHFNVEGSDGTFVPEFRTTLMYDLAGDNGSSTNTFTGGGAAFQVEGMDVVEFSASVGVGLAYKPNFKEMDGVSFAVNYDAEFKDAFTGQSGSLNLRYAF